MKKQKFSLQVRMCLSVGLMIQSISIILNHYLLLHDILRGLMQGLSIGLIAFALLKQNKDRNQLCRNQYRRFKGVSKQLR